jgi:uncharacterized phage protein (TIGR01671 family)
MREILFRGFVFEKLCNGGKWVYGHYVKVNNTYRIWDGVTNWIVMPETVGQYTGRKNKKGDEFFDGDIGERRYLNGWVRFVIEWVDLSYYAGFVGKVLAGEYYTYDINENGAEYLYIGCPYYDESELIGNRFENPELLKQ